MIVETILEITEPNDADLGCIIVGYVEGGVIYITNTIWLR